MKYLDTFIPGFCAFFCFMMCGGIYYNFGTLYVYLLDETSMYPPLLTMVGTSSDMIYCFLNPYGAMFAKKYGISSGILIGGFLLASGLILSSFLEIIHLWFLSYSFISGVGIAMTYMAAIEMIYTKIPPSIRSFIMGLATGGMFIGVSTFAPLIIELEKQFDLWIALRIFGAIYFVMTILICLVWNRSQAFLTTNPPKIAPTLSMVEPGMNTLSTGEFVDTNTIFYWVTDWRFRNLFICTLLMAFGYGVPFTHLLKAAEDDHIENVDIIPIVMGISGFIGRFFFGASADALSKKWETPNLNLYALCIFACGISLCVTPACNTLIHYCIIAGTYAFFGGGRVGLMSIMCGEVFGDSTATVAYGYLCWGYVPTQLFGPGFVAGMEEKLGSYAYGFIIVGIITVISLLPLVTVIWSQPAKKVCGEKKYEQLPH